MYKQQDYNITDNRGRNQTCVVSIMPQTYFFFQIYLLQFKIFFFISRKCLINSYDRVFMLFFFSDFEYVYVLEKSFNRVKINSLFSF